MSAHEMVIGKAQHLLAKSITKFGENHPKVKETHFLLRAYHRNVNDRKAFHKLTRIIQTLADMLEEQEAKEAAMIVGGPASECDNEDEDADVYDAYEIQAEQEDEAGDERGAAAASGTEAEQEAVQVVTNADELF